MPSPYLKKLSRETGKSIRELEKDWEEAKQITADFFGKRERDFGEKEYKYATSIVKKMAGVNEEFLDVSKFLKSGLSARQYIEQVTGVQTSGDFDIGTVKPPKKKKKKDDEDETEEGCKDKKEVADKDKKKKKKPIKGEEDPEDDGDEDDDLAEHIASLDL